MQISPLPPVVLGGLLFVPKGLVDRLTGRTEFIEKHTVNTHTSAARARKIITDIERKLGNDLTDREVEMLGYDIESRTPGTGRLRFSEVMGQVSGTATIIVIRNEFLILLNNPGVYILE